MASLLLTYFFWMFGGFFGLHHLYLGRVYHAFVWYSTFGGVFGLGLLRDLWRIPEYVRSSNADKMYRTKRLHRISRYSQPKCGWIRFAGMVVMGWLTSAVLLFTLPSYEIDESGHMLYWLYSIILVLIGTSFGVYIVANVGEMQCSFRYPVMGALASLPWLLHDSSNIFMPATISMIVTWWWGLRWKPLESLKSNKCLKFLQFSVMTVWWTSILCYGVYYNATVSLDGEERIPVREALNNFFSSPAWRETRQAFSQIYEAFMAGTWEDLFDDTIDIFDISGEIAAFKVIELPRNATNEEITKKCRKMSAQTHPDRFKTEAEKQTAQDRFIEIQSACSTLNKYHSRAKSRSQGG